MDSLSASLSRVRLLVLDVDGVLCDGRTWQDALGRLRRSFSVRDEIALRRLRRTGVKVAILTLVTAPEVRELAERVGVDFFIEGCEDKAVALDWVRRSESLDTSEAVVFLADPADVPLLAESVLGVTSPAVDDRVRKAAQLATRTEAGDGAVSEVCGWILTAKRAQVSASSSESSGAGARGSGLSRRAGSGK